MKKLLTLLTTLLLLFAITQSAMAQSYYMVGQLLKSNVKDWSEKNEDGYKFETTDHVNYFYTVYNTKANFDFRFRIGTEGNSKPTSYHPITVETSGTHKNGRLLKKDEPVTDMEKSTSDNYWYFIMEAYNSYTFHFNAETKSLHVTKGTTLGKAKDFDLVAEYKNAAGTTVQEMIVPFIESRVRKERDGKMPYSDILATAAFKDEQLPGKKGDKIRIYARKRDDNNITLNPATDENTFGEEERQPAYNNNSSYSSIKSYKTESFVTNRPENAFVITKGSGVSYTVALNLGGEIKTTTKETSGKNNNISHYVKANSLSLFINKSMSKVYKDYAESKGKNYDETTANFYLIGAMDGKNYKYKKDDAKLMERRVYTNPITNETDSIVYTSLVQWNDANPNGLWFSFAPEIIYDLGLNWAPSDPYDGNSAWNHIARAQVQDEYDATAPYGCMNLSGNYSNVLCNGEQALNPKVKDPDYKYYVVRFNVTTSTYRLIFYKENPVVIKRSKNKYIRTFSSNANWDLPTDGTVKAYVVHSFDKDATNGGKKSQGVMRLREITYIPAEMGVVLVGNGTEGTGDEMKVTLRSRWTDLVTSENMRELWKNKDKYPGETFKNYLVGLPTDGADITEGDYDEEHHCYVDRNFALNWFSNTKTGQSLKGTLNLAEQSNGDAGTDDYLGFFRLKGKVNKEYAYLKLPKSVVDYDLQLTGGKKENDKDIKEWDAKLSPNFALAFDTDFGTVSGINSLSNTKKNVNNSCYTLQGVKVQRPTAPGLYIMNGKKVIVK
mgnify:CR=1 FL=1